MATVGQWFTVLNELRKNSINPLNSNARNTFNAVKNISNISESGGLTHYEFPDLPEVNYKPNGTISNSGSALNGWIDNALTGDRDFQRQVYLQQMQQDFNSAEAALAYDRQVNTAKNSTLWQAEQLRQLGVNPAWAIAGGGGSNATVSTAPTATSQAGSASTSGQQATSTLNTFVQLVVTAARLALLKK